MNNFTLKKNQAFRTFISLASSYTENTMKPSILFFVALFLCAGVSAQTMEQTIEKRARELHRVISLESKSEWEKFVKENYSQALIERPMKAQTKREGGGTSSTETQETKGTVADKVNMLQRLHNDFAGSKIASVKVNAGEVEMIVNGSGVSGTFRLKFTPSALYLIDRIGIQIEGSGM
ncbi:MAG TPA: hypothetical protein DGG95_15780 [Cytophagales bacterium]|nr:hypothetical protein [Cytophagales bacterium]